MGDPIILQNLYESLELASESDYLSHNYNGLSLEEVQYLSKKNYHIYQGKVRDLLISDKNLFMIHTDRLSAFDKSIALLPYKGVILTDISHYWFEYFGNSIQHHLIERTHERVLRVKKTEPFKIEVVVRAFMAGSMQNHYLMGKRLFCGNKLPEGLKKHSKLPNPIITPTTKAAAYQHDEEISAKELIEKKVCSASQWDEISSLALNVFEIGQKRFKEIGWLLVDTKYEFGLDDTGAVVLIDEVHTPDSSRLWRLDSFVKGLESEKEPEMFDKQIIRNFLLEQGFAGEGVPPKIPRQLALKTLGRYLEVAQSLRQKPLKTIGNSAAFPVKLVL